MSRVSNSANSAVPRQAVVPCTISRAKEAKAIRVAKTIALNASSDCRVYPCPYSAAARIGCRSEGQIILLTT